MDGPDSIRACRGNVGRLLQALAAADIHGDAFQPAEGYHVAMAALRCYAGMTEKGKGSLSHLLVEAHRIYYPFMGERRSAASRRAGVLGAPPGHPYFTEVLRDGIVSDNKGTNAAAVKYGDRTANAVMLGACLAAGVRHRLSESVEDGYEIARLIHRHGTSLALGGFVAAVSWYALRNDGHHPSQIIQVLMKEDPLFRLTRLDTIRERVRLGSVDAILPPDEPLVPAWDVARILGAALIGPEPVKDVGPGLSRVLGPMAAPLLDYATAVTIKAPGPCVREIDAVTAALQAKGIVA